MDAQTTLADTAGLAALVQSIVRLEVEGGAETYDCGIPPEVLAENRFLAARDGMDAELIAHELDERVPARALLEDLLVLCRPHAEALGCAAELEAVSRLADRTGARRQLELSRALGPPPRRRRPGRRLPRRRLAAGTPSSHGTRAGCGRVGGRSVREMPNRQPTRARHESHVPAWRPQRCVRSRPRTKAPRRRPLVVERVAGRDHELADDQVRAEFRDAVADAVDADLDHGGAAAGVERAWRWRRFRRRAGRRRRRSASARSW